MQFFDRGGAGRGVAFALKLPGMAWVVPVLGLVRIAAVAGATQDIGTDGVYVTTLAEGPGQVPGFQSMCWNWGALLAKGPFVTRERHAARRAPADWGTAWMIVMLVDRRHRVPDGPVSQPRVAGGREGAGLAQDASATRWGRSARRSSRSSRSRASSA